MKQKTLKQQIIEHVARFSFGTAIQTACQFIVSFFAARLLGPFTFGIWQTAKLVLGYGGFLNLGTSAAMHREIPLLKGKKDTEKSSETTNVTFTFTFIVAVIASILTFGATILIKFDKDMALCLKFISLIIFFRHVGGVYLAWFKANNKFEIVSNISIIQGVGNLLSVVLIYFFSLKGFLAGQVIRVVSGTIYSYSTRMVKIRLLWNFSELKRLILIGFPILLLGFSAVLFRTVDRILVVSNLGFGSMGFYSLSALVTAPVMLIIYPVGSVMYPRFSEKYGSSGKMSDLKKYIIVPMEILALFIPVLLGAIYIALPALVNIFLPKYIEGITAARILMIGVFFSGVIGTTGNFFLATNKQILYLFILLGSALFNLGVSFVLIRLGFGIAGVAGGTALSYLIYSFTMFIIALTYCNAKKIEIAKLICKLLLPLAYTIVMVILVENFIRIQGISKIHMLSTLFSKELAFLALTSYLMFLAWKRIGAGGLIRKDKER